MPSWTDRRHTDGGDGGRKVLRPLRRFWPRRTLTAAVALCGLLCPLSLLVAAQDAPTVSSAKPTTYRLSGVVLDSARAPVLEAEVTLIEAGVVRRRVVTDSAGRFALGELTAGPIALRVRRLGYRQQTLDVQPGAGGQSASVEIILAVVPAELEGIVVNTSPPERLREFYERREQRHGFARFLEYAEISRRAPRNPSDLFRSVPGITIRAASGGGNTIRVRGCQPMVWVDGQRIPGAELDEVVQPSDIGGIEFYPSSAGIPAQYMDPSNRLCGLILVWTRSE